MRREYRTQRHLDMADIPLRRIFDRVDTDGTGEVDQSALLRSLKGDPNLERLLGLGPSGALCFLSLECAVRLLLRGSVLVSLTVAVRSAISASRGYRQPQTP